MMTATSIGRILVPFVALAAIALVVAVKDVPREPAVEASLAPTASTPSYPASGAPIESSPALTATETQTAAGAAASAVSPASPVTDPVTDKSVPVFDIARIEPTGDAVIAGRADPGAIVDLLRSGERLDRTVADSSGQFVMAPLLPPGSYELTLTARSLDGTLATSKQGVAVALDEVRSDSGAARSRADAPPLNAAETVTTQGLPLDHTGKSSQARLSPQPRLPAAKLLDNATLQRPHMFAAAPSNGRSLSPLVAHRSLTRVVSPGDSLWRISRTTYGAGTQYMLVYRANRERIRDPNHIYPGQIFVLPMKAH